MGEVKSEKNKKILVIGDGDMAYSAALSAMVKGADVYGSVLPTREAQERLYTKEAVDKREATVKGNGGDVFYGVDCTKVHEHEVLKDSVILGSGFDEVHFNFPHLGYSQQAERGGKWSRANVHIEFFKKMFASLKAIQPTEGIMKLTLTSTPPYSIKEVKKAAISSGYVFEEELKFNHQNFAGYHPAWGDDRDLSKPGTSGYGEEGRQLCFRHLSCHPCTLSCTGAEQLAQHLKTIKHQQGIRKYRARLRTVKGEAQPVKPVQKKKKKKKPTGPIRKTFVLLAE